MKYNKIKKLIGESIYLLNTYSPKSCPNWKEYVGDCNNCESCRVTKCIDNLERFESLIEKIQNK